LQVWGNIKKKPIKKYIPLENGEPGDYLVKWTELNGLEHFRYYHLFSKCEFLELIHSQINDIENLKILYEFENWIAIFNVK
jgi:hypothetical protein